MITEYIKVEVDISHIVPQQDIQVVFEYLDYPLRGKKPLGILQCINQDKICVIVLKRRGSIIFNKSHPFNKIIFSRLSKSLRKKISNYVVCYIVNDVIDQDQFERTYLEAFNQTEITPWFSPAGLNRGSEKQ